MVLEWESEWEKIYHHHQEVKYDVLPSVKFATEIFKRNDCIKILNLGHESSQHSIFLAANGFKVIPAKLTKTRIDVAASQTKKSNNNNVRVQQDMRPTCLEEQCVDGILCVWTLGYGALEDASQHVSEMYRLVKAGGLVVIDYISVENPHFHKQSELKKPVCDKQLDQTSTRHHYYSIEDLKQLYKKFTKVEISPIEYQFTDELEKEHKLKAFMVIATK